MSTLRRLIIKNLDSAIEKLENGYEVDDVIKELKEVSHDLKMYPISDNSSTIIGYLKGFVTGLRWWSGTNEEIQANANKVLDDLATNKNYTEVNS